MGHPRYEPGSGWKKSNHRVTRGTTTLTLTHANAALTPRARLRLARLIVEDRWPVIVAARMFMVSPVTARKWLGRYRAEGAAGMADRSSRPRSMPAKTPPEVVKRIVTARWRRRLGPVQIAGELGMAASTVYAVLVRCRINRLAHLDRVTGEPLRRYEHPHPGSLIHVDVTKFGNIPDGGGWRFVGKQQGDRNREATAKRTGRRHGHYEPNVGTAFVHTVIDDHSFGGLCGDLCRREGGHGDRCPAPGGRMVHRARREH